MLIGLAVFVALIVVLALLLDPIATWGTRRGLNKLKGFKASFSDVAVSVFPPRYTISRLKIVDDPARDWSDPLFYADRMTTSVAWRRLLHGDLVFDHRIDAPKVAIIQRSRNAESDESGAGKAKKLPDLLNEAPAVKLDRIAIKDGEVLFVDLTRENRPRFWVHDIEFAAENIATRSALSEGRSTVISGRAVVQKSGKLTLFASADPFAKGLTFAGRAGLQGLRVEDLYDVIEPATKLQATDGTFDCFVEFAARNGALSGGVKPMLKNVEIAATSGNIFNRFKAWIADSTLELFSDDVPGRDAVATTIPIKGDVKNPQTQLLPTVLGVVRNGFVQGLQSGFAHLPPPTAEKKEGVIRQVKDALKKKEGPPEAQPVKNGGGK